MKHRIVLLAVLLALQGSARAQCGGGGRRRGGGGEPAPDLPVALAAVHDTVSSRGPDNKLAEVSEVLVRSYRNITDPLNPLTASQALEALALAAAGTEKSPYRGAVMLARGQLLELLVRPEAAQAAMDMAVRLLQTQALPQVATGSDYEAAQAAVDAQDEYTTSMQKWVMSKLLMATRSLTELGQENLVDAMLAPLPAAAIALRLPSGYIGAMGQKNKLTDAELEELIECTARLDKQPAPKEKEGAEGAEAAAEGVTVGEPGGPCPWLFNITQEQGTPMYYTLHRALHSRKRYDEAWAALATAKVLSGPGPEWEAEDYAAMLRDLAIIFPPADEAAEGAGVEVVDIDEHEDEDYDDGGDEDEEKGQETGAGDASAGNGTAPPPPVAAPVQGVAARATAVLRRVVGAGHAALDRLAELAGLSKEASHKEVKEAPAPSKFAHLHEIRPIFVTGLPRSGSTLVEQILSSHPDVWGAGEHSRLGPVVTDLLDDIADSGSVSAARMQELSNKYTDGMRSMMPSEALNATWLVDKNLGNAWHLGHIALLMPRACILHAVRHPADTSLSSFQQSFSPANIPWSFNLTHLANHVAAHHKIMAHWKRALPGRVLDVHYSQMVDDMEGTTKKILEHCNLTWHPNMLKFYETKRFVYTASLLQVRRPIYSTSVGKWQAYKQGLAPLLVSLRDTILSYEEQAGLPSSRDVIAELAAELAAAAQQTQRTQHAPGSEVVQEQLEAARQPAAATAQDVKKPAASAESAVAADLGGACSAEGSAAGSCAAGEAGAGPDPAS